MDTNRVAEIALAIIIAAVILALLSMAVQTYFIKYGEPVSGCTCSGH